MEEFEIPSRDGIIVSRNRDGGWTLTVSLTRATVEELRGTGAFAAFVVQFMALFAPSASKEN